MFNRLVGIKDSVRALRCRAVISSVAFVKTTLCEQVGPPGQLPWAPASRAPSAAARSARAARSSLRAPFQPAWFGAAQPAAQPLLPLGGDGGVGPLRRQGAATAGLPSRSCDRQPKPWGSALLAQVYQEGTHLMVPWFDRPIIYDVRARPSLISSTSGSRDLQMVRCRARGARWGAPVLGRWRRFARRVALLQRSGAAAAARRLGDGCCAFAASQTRTGWCWWGLPADTFALASADPASRSCRPCPHPPQVNIGLRVLTRPNPDKLAQLYRCVVSVRSVWTMATSGMCRRSQVAVRSQMPPRLAS